MTKNLTFSNESELSNYAKRFPTPFYLYDQSTIEAQCQKLKEAFSWEDGFQNYFAVKATPNPNVLKIIKQQGFGVDCSSIAELLLAEAVGFNGEKIFFTSNNSTIDDYKKAMELDAIFNFDDPTHLKAVCSQIGIPNHVCFRYNPGYSRKGNSILGNPADAKFGLTREQITEAYQEAQTIGCKKYSLHTMIVSNCLEENELFETAKMMFTLVQELYETSNIVICRLNLGGGIGIPYRPEDQAVNLNRLGEKIKSMYFEMLERGCFQPFRLSFECGRFITGPAGVLLTRVINKKKTFRHYLGVDASIANLLRPAMYGSYHHVTHIKCRNPNASCTTNETTDVDEIFDIVGSLCENNDKLATDRDFGANVSIGDILVFHDAGAHGSAMGFNYNGKLRCAEYLLGKDGQPQLIRRVETYSDLFATIIW